MTDAPYRLIGTPRFGGLLVVSDHASARVPAGIDLGVAPGLMAEHIALDIGVNEVAEAMAALPGTAAFLGNVSRLVIDLNREEDAPAAVPIASDGHAIPGNAIDHAARMDRVARFHQPYHAALADVLERTPPGLILSLHSFTPSLASKPDEARPWQVGVLYNEDDRAARIAIALLRAEGLAVGDQQPYSGRLLNYTMNRHAEADGRPYLGIELRNDEVRDPAACAQWAQRLHRICAQVLLTMGE